MQAPPFPFEKLWLPHSLFHILQKLSKHYRGEAAMKTKSVLSLEKHKWRKAFRWLLKGRVTKSKWLGECIPYSSCSSGSTWKMLSPFPRPGVIMEARLLLTFLQTVFVWIKGPRSDTFPICYTTRSCIFLSACTVLEMIFCRCTVAASFFSRG